MKLNQKQKIGLGSVIGGILVFVFGTITMPPGLVELITKAVGFAATLFGFAVNFPADTSDR